LPTSSSKSASIPSVFGGAREIRLNDMMDRMNGWIGGMDGRTGGWMDGWIAGLMGGWIGTYGRF
jgi:hypothetical protein